MVSAGGDKHKKSIRRTLIRTVPAHTIKVFQYAIDIIRFSLSLMTHLDQLTYFIFFSVAITAIVCFIEWYLIFIHWFWYESLEWMLLIEIPNETTHKKNCDRPLLADNDQKDAINENFTRVRSGWIKRNANECTEIQKPEIPKKKTGNELKWTKRLATISCVWCESGWWWQGERLRNEEIVLGFGF